MIVKSCDWNLLDESCSKRELLFSCNMFVDQNDRWLRREEQRLKKMEGMGRTGREWEQGLREEYIPYWAHVMDIGCLPTVESMWY